MDYFSNRKSILSFIRYVVIGALVFSIDFGLLNWLLTNHFALTISVTFAYVVGMIFHFTLNRFFNFKNFERTIAKQLRTYLVVAFICWLATIMIIPLAVNVFKMTTFWSRVLAVAFNIPIGFVAHKYFTFGGGIRKTLFVLFNKNMK